MKLRWLSAAALIFATSLLAQQVPAVPATVAVEKKPAEASAPTFKTRSQLVLVPVVVNDKSGKHVAGLAKDAFRLNEDGKPRDVALFEEVFPEKKNAGSEVNQPSGVASNFSSEGVPHHFTIVLLDMVNTPFLKQTEGKRQLMDFLAKGLQPGEPVTLLGLSGKGVVQLHSFTTDTRVLIAALQKLDAKTTSGEMADAEAQQQTEQNADLMDSANANAQQISQFIQDAIDSAAAFQQRDSIRRTLEALNQVAQAYSGNRARKTLIWASAGFPFMINDPRAFANMGVDMVQQYEKTWRALTSANIAVYPVELVGLDSRHADASQGNAPFHPARMNHGRSMGTSAGLSYDLNNQRQESLKAFADATGGRPCLNSNDFKKCFADAIEDSQSYYLLGYYLPGNEGKTGWRKLKVHVNAPDTHVRAREGFYVAPPSDDNPATRREEVVAALSSPFEYTGVLLDVRTASSTPLDAKDGSTASEPRKVLQDFFVHIPASSLVIDAANGNRVDLEIAADRDRRLRQRCFAVFSDGPSVFQSRDVCSGLEERSQPQRAVGTYPRKIRLPLRGSRQPERRSWHGPYAVRS